MLERRLSIYMASNRDRETLPAKIEDSEHCQYEDAALGIERLRREELSNARSSAGPLSDDNFGNYVFAFRFELRVFVST